MNTPHSDHHHDAHETSLIAELTCHLPFAAFSVALCFVAIALLQFFVTAGGSQVSGLKHAYKALFHVLHYLHIMFAVAGTLVSYSRFSGRLSGGFGLALISPAFFCTLSDVALPSLASKILGVSIKMHVCFFHWHDFVNLVPFMIMGLVSGIALARHHELSRGFFTLGYHFFHIMLSALASLVYVVSYGFTDWSHSVGLLYFLLVLAVVVPCTISDLVVPFYFARYKGITEGEHEEHSAH